MTGKTSAIWELGASAGLRGAVATALLVGLALTPAHAFQSDRERKSYRDVKSYRRRKRWLA